MRQEPNDIPPTDLVDRTGLPDALRVLLHDYPRVGWDADPGFDGLVRFWLDRHMMFRRLMDDMQSATEAALDGETDPQRYRALVSRYGGMFVNGLHEHHTIEDVHYFPKLAAKDARIAAGFAMLDADHHALDENLSGFVKAANGILQAPAEATALKDASGAFHGQLAGFAQLLDRHLLDEEDLIVPVILRYGTADLG